jgi:hypothetical protein
MTSADIYPLAQRLHALIPEGRRWAGVPGDPVERDCLADALLWACEEAGFGGPQIHAEPDEAGAIDPQSALQAVIISEALAGFVTG